jgi:threonylcarbamoyladenosine tRNA methylthiotransferase MtaB
MVAITNVPIVYSTYSQRISRSDELENNAAECEISAQNIKEIVLTGVNIGTIWKEFGNKKHEHTFLPLVQELDKVEGIERLQFRQLKTNLLKK